MSTAAIDIAPFYTLFKDCFNSTVLIRYCLRVWLDPLRMLLSALMVILSFACLSVLPTNLKSIAIFQPKVCQEQLHDRRASPSTVDQLQVEKPQPPTIKREPRAEFSRGCSFLGVSSEEQFLLLAIKSAPSSRWRSPTSLQVSALASRVDGHPRSIVLHGLSSSRYL